MLKCLIHLCIYILISTFNYIVDLQLSLFFRLSLTILVGTSSPHCNGSQCEGNESPPEGGILKTTKPPQVWEWRARGPLSEVHVQGSAWQYRQLRGHLHCLDCHPRDSLLRDGADTHSRQHVQQCALSGLCNHFYFPGKPKLICALPFTLFLMDLLFQATKVVEDVFLGHVCNAILFFSLTFVVVSMPVSFGLPPITLDLGPSEKIVKAGEDQQTFRGHERVEVEGVWQILLVVFLVSNSYLFCHLAFVTGWNPKINLMINLSLGKLPNKASLITQGPALQVSGSNLEKTQDTCTERKLTDVTNVLSFFRFTQCYPSRPGKLYLLEPCYLSCI